MKNIRAVLPLALLLPVIAWSQNTFPSSGSAGIGTTSPTATLQVDSGNADSQVYISSNGPRIALGNNSTYASRTQAVRLVMATSAGEFGPFNAGDAWLFTEGQNGGTAGNLYLGANLSTTLTLTTGGNVGIGTKSPAGKLTIAGAGGAASTDGVEWYSAGNANGYNGWIGRIYGGTPTGAWGTAPFIFAVPGTGGAEIQTMTLLNGNVGIGTTNPAASLHVLGNVGREVARFQGSTDVSNNRNFISIYTTNPGYSWELSNQDPAGNGTLNGLAFRERSASGNSIERVYFASGGNVGIGTTNPTYPLSVRGTVRAQEVIVDTGWSDYVFKPDYRLAPLGEVQKSIEKEGHLPGMPSAKEVAEHGISVGDMQAKLLAKIEELTLHQIEQEKLLAAQQEQLETQQGEIRALKRAASLK